MVKSSTARGLTAQQLKSGQFWLLPHRVFEPVIEFDPQTSVGPETWQRLSGEGLSPCLIALFHWLDPFMWAAKGGGRGGQLASAQGPALSLELEMQLSLWLV